MRYFVLLLMLCLLTMIPTGRVGHEAVSINVIPKLVETTVSSAQKVVLGFHQTSRNLLLLFLIVLSYFCYHLIRAWITPSEAEEANRIKSKLQRDLSAKTLKALREKLAEKERQLAILALAMEEKDHTLRGLRTQVSDWYHDAEGDFKIELHAFRYTIDRSLNRQQNWLSFQKQLSQVHPGFISRLQKEFPNLSVNDLRLCSYLRMNLSTREIASLTNIHQNSVQKARYRLKKKLGLPADQDLYEFIIGV